MPSGELSPRCPSLAKLSSTNELLAALPTHAPKEQAAELSLILFMAQKMARHGAGQSNGRN